MIKDILASIRFVTHYDYVILIYYKTLLLSKNKSLYTNEDYAIERIYYTNSKNFINSWFEK